MEKFNFADAWQWLLVAASALVLLNNAFKSLADIVRAVKAPNTKQDERLTELEEWKTEVDRKLDNDNRRLESLKEGNRASQQALLALLDHSLDGNNIEQMEKAKAALHSYLVSGR